MILSDPCFCLQLHAETEKAFLLSPDGDEDHSFWLPKSVIEYDYHGSDGFVLCFIPKWLRKKVGLPEDGFPIDDQPPPKGRPKLRVVK